ncbi:protein kinase domain-containing protein [Capillimicrobium parvum]|uniref:non-specific serine/threonine protein kinase n=1 Tax=Capillimicrobium parvum TaxID=2884022 RepID=A0A9E6XSU5_9ACTN|nr:protein kinase [Capillimicrobium parvum]UGS33685.1 Serine/threonine-protein kinase PknD [Capillimicrobium parvum]
MTTPVGTLLSGRYRLDAQIGSGGMSTVFRAFDTVLERPVAIKLMHREMSSDSDQLERFRREARAVAQLNHPHIVQVIDAGEDDNTPYIVLEYIEGQTLKDCIRRKGRLPIPEAIAYAIEIARALEAAHARAIVHRDVKPQNVLIDSEGSAKVTDFGIARTLTEEGLTADGRVLGTTDYVSPEQALGHPVTGQSDIYSLGIVLYEMLTGEVPFRGENQVAVAMKHVREDLPDVSMRRPEISTALAAVVDHATAKELERRYQDAASLAADLEDVLAIETARAGDATGEATTVLRTLPGSARRRLPWRARVPRLAVIALLLLAAGAIGAVVLLARDNTERGTRPPDIKPQTPGLHVVALRSKAAHDYDPFGGDGEHSDEASAAIDDDSKSTWSTESYQAGALNKPGVGLYVDAAPGVAAQRMELRTTTPGWSGAVYAAEDGPPDSIGGWTKVASLNDVKRSQQISLDTAGKRFRYYLVWIEKLPEGGENATISDLALLK